MTGFELNRTLRYINKIRDLAVQITEKPSKKTANLQPDATKIPAITAHLSKGTREINLEYSSGPPARRHHITQKIRIGEPNRYVSVHDDQAPAEIFLLVKGADYSSETIASYDVIARLMSIALQYGASIEKLGDLLTGAQFAPGWPVSGFYLGQGRICSAGARVSAQYLPAASGGVRTHQVSRGMRLGSG